MCWHEIRGLIVSPMREWEKVAIWTHDGTADAN